MKIKQIFVLLLLVALACPQLKAQSYDELWKRVAKEKKEGLPQSARKLTEEIFQKAANQHDIGQMLKAFVERAYFTTVVTPDSFYVDLNRLQQWEDTTSNPIDKAVINSMIMSEYAQYANDNQWQLQRRTQIEGETPSSDIRLWTTNQFVDAVRQRALASLAPTQQLIDTSTRGFVPFVTLGKNSSYYNHSLYFLLATRSVDALQQIQWGSATTQIGQTIDSLYNKMLDVCQAQRFDDGYVLTALDYLKWKNLQVPSIQPRFAATDSLSNQIYVQGLDRLIADYGRYPTCAEVYLAKANYLNQQGNPALAFQICNEALKRYPSYSRNDEFRNLKGLIQLPMLNVQIPEVAYPDSKLDLRISYKNVAQFTLEFLQDKKVILKTPIRLVSKDQYVAQDTTISITAPSIGKYTYRVVAGKEMKIESTKAACLNVTRLKLLSMPLPGQQKAVVVVDAQSGQPIQGATVELLDATDGVLFSLTTDAKGAGTLSTQGNYRNIAVKYGNDTFLPYERFYKGNYVYYNSDKATNVIKLITDRTLYRPGQTIHVKGIAYCQQGDTANVIRNQSYTLSLFDANNQSIAQKELITNEFGSFTTSFVLPTSCLNGTFNLKTELGSTRVQVADYKLPTFEVTFDKPTVAYHLGDTLNLSGSVQSLTGVALQDVPVSYQVYRIPYRWWFDYSQTKELIASGTVNLNDAGGFVIPVELLAPQTTTVGYYKYLVEASATSLSGETQSGTFTLNAGNRSLILSIDLPNLVNKDSLPEVKCTVVNLDNQSLKVKGHYALYRKNEEASVAQTLKGAPIEQGEFIANQPLMTTAWSSLASGRYLLSCTATDSQGRTVTEQKEFILFSLSDSRPPVKQDEWFYAVNTAFSAEHPAVFYYGTSQKDAFVMLNVFSGNHRIESKTFNLSDSIVRFEYPYDEDYGNGLTLVFCYVKNNTLKQYTVRLTKKAADKSLQMKWEVFRDKLRPGQEEEWKLTIKTPQDYPACAEMLALMYDAALDKIYPNNQLLKVYYGSTLPSTRWSTAATYVFGSYSANTYNYKNVAPLLFDQFISNSILQTPELDEVVTVGYGKPTRRLNSNTGGLVIRGANKISPAFDLMESTTPVLAGSSASTAIEEQPADIRTAFAETAFFYPQLRTNEQGEISLSFTVPESLTRWSFRGFAHTQGMLVGNMNAEATTSKEFMLMPNMPRFVRMGDKVTIAATLTNLTDKVISGTATMVLFDPYTNKTIATQKQPFAVAGDKISAVSFNFTASDKYELLGCRMIADGGQFSDGEQRVIPVLTNKAHLTESIVMQLKNKESRTFSLASLFNHHSPSATNRSLTVEFTANPAWYAVQALPALALPDNNSAISWATAYYANSLAAWIVDQNPRIQTIFDNWRKQGGTKETLISNLQKNQELKNILLSETPWVLQAATEQEQIDRIATLFEVNNIRNNNLSALNRLQELQLSNGAWSWYKGMDGSTYITQFIATLNARLAQLCGTPLAGQALAMQQAAMTYLHQQALSNYQELTDEQRSQWQLTDGALRYLYLIALSREAVAKEYTKPYEFYLSKVNALLTTGSVTQKAMAAIILKQLGNQALADKFMASLKEYLTESDSQGMYFAFNENPYRWSGMQIPAHVLVMEAFQTVTNDQPVVEAMKVWLLKQKQTQSWESPIASADAIYALLMRGSNLLSNSDNVILKIGKQQLATNGHHAIPGLGYFKETFVDKSIVDASQVWVSKADSGLAWGAVYAQYQEDINKVKQQGGELDVVKKLYVKRIVNGTEQLLPVEATTTLKVGDVVVSRLSITINRAMDFVQLKDERAACFEPIASISGYQWSNGFGYYVDIKDASTSFFFNSLTKGVYVLEHSYRVSRAGTYQSGLATLQSAYAPQYNSHSSAQQVTIVE